MKKIQIGIFTNRKKDKDLNITNRVVELIRKYGMHPHLAGDLSDSQKVRVPYDSVFAMENSDFVISLGGDGTLLRTARTIFKYDIPVLGINLGTVGFLAEVEKNEIEKAIERLSKGDFKLKNRMVLSALVDRNGETVYKSIALNDVVVSRDGLSRIIRLKVLVDGQFIDSFPGDGVIISTPTGSTAYTLSAGGPIVQPDMRLMITTPICPHILYSRSFITSPEKELSLSVNDDYPDSATMTLDGQEGFNIVAGDRITIRQADKDIRFVSINSGINFYDVLRAKIRV
ncbi:MAG: NAD(+)/NADH kinase [Clostridiaceae bacterium]|jgi:NAD+ kinase|nr:NAD(+)/NADH kinase [Clostridiaceae bacterium]